eukprot:SAG31_NODE_1814_length_7210_cov_12.878920_1_plen_168_part_00
MAAVHVAETEPEPTARGKLSTVAATGSELISPAQEEKEASACLGDSAVRGEFLPAVRFISLPECSGWDGHFHGTNGSVASCGADSLGLIDEHFICRCALHFVAHPSLSLAWAASYTMSVPVASNELIISDSVTHADSTYFFGGVVAAGHFCKNSIISRYESSALPSE